MSSCSRLRGGGYLPSFRWFITAGQFAKISNDSLRRGRLGNAQLHCLSSLFRFLKLQASPGVSQSLQFPVATFTSGVRGEQFYPVTQRAPLTSSNQICDLVLLSDEF